MQRQGQREREMGDRRELGESERARERKRERKSERARERAEEI